MSTTVPGDEEIRRLAEASAWRVHLGEHDLETSEGFEAWLAADPQNEAAWDHVQADWLHIGEQANSPELLKLRSDALDRARRQSHARWTWPAQRFAVAACVLLMLLVGVGGGTLWWRAQPTVYQTAMGERRSITFDDGSRASLDAGTELRVRYTDDSRKLELVRGQARFDVAHDAMRPFVVQARDRTIIATGTAFNVDLLGPKVFVTLIEGRVVIVDKKSNVAPLAAFRSRPAASVELTPGQQLIAAPSAPPEVETVSLDRTGAWETGMLEFDDEPLSSVVERVGRYSPVPITVAPGAANMRMSGVFKAGDVATFIDVVTRYLPVKAQQSQGQTVISPKA
jgi:transmembrane sensor